MSLKSNEVEAYLAQFSGEMLSKLNSIRNLIFDISPDVSESISYGMPAYKYKNKVIIYFAGYKNHIGVYALPNTHQHFAEKLAKYKQGKGSVQFPNKDELPLELIREMILFRFENAKLSLI